MWMATGAWTCWPAATSSSTGAATGSNRSAWRTARGESPPAGSCPPRLPRSCSHPATATARCLGDLTDPQAWHRRRLIDRDVIHGHSLAVADINANGHLDIFCAEMHTPGNKDNCTARLLYGNGRGHFTVERLSVGIGKHESRVGDVDGDGRLDIVTKPYTWDTPRLDLWLNAGSP